MRRVSFPLMMGLGLFTWTLSAFVVVDESQLAVRERLGKVKDGEVLEPGLSIGLPWPFDRVQVVDTERIRSMPLGFSGAKADVNALWTQYHAAEEYNLLIGNGRDLVTVNAELQYRISDIHQWIYGCQNPEQALETLAYRVLMEATVDRTLDEVLSKEIGSFSARLKDGLQKQADEKGLGVELVALNLRGLHPPVALAKEYQSVIAAQLDRTTYIIEAEAYQESTLPRARAEAESALRTAAADRVRRLSFARGEAIAFGALEAQYKTNPQLYRFRNRLETLEAVLEGKPFHVIDARIERDGGALWFLQ
jgi:HflK protein